MERNYIKKNYQLSWAGPPKQCIPAPISSRKISKKIQLFPPRSNENIKINGLNNRINKNSQNWFSIERHKRLELNIQPKYNFKWGFEPREKKTKKHSIASHVQPCVNNQYKGIKDGNRRDVWKQRLWSVMFRRHIKEKLYTHKFIYKQG